jgi:hypothetical protein
MQPFRMDARHAVWRTQTGCLWLQEREAGTAGGPINAPRGVGLDDPDGPAASASLAALCYPDLLVDRDGFRAKGTAIGNGLDAGRDRGIECLPVPGVDIARQ